jgi:hypothetical protein
MKIARIDVDWLRPFATRGVHAHIEDHLGMNTRDQAVGSWSSIERRDRRYYGYMRLLESLSEELGPATSGPRPSAQALVSQSPTGFSIHVR